MSETTEEEVADFPGTSYPEERDVMQDKRENRKNISDQSEERLEERIYQRQMQDENIRTVALNIARSLYPEPISEKINVPRLLNEAWLISGFIEEGVVHGEEDPASP